LQLTLEVIRPVAGLQSFAYCYGYIRCADSGGGPAGVTAGMRDGQLLLLHKLLHIGPIHFAHVDRAFRVDSYGGRIAEPLNLLQNLAVFYAGDQQAVVRGPIDNVNQAALYKQAPRCDEGSLLV